MKVCVFRPAVAVNLGHLASGLLLLTLCPQVRAQADYTPYVFNTLAGIYGSDDGPGSSVRLNNPEAVAVDSTGNVYCADLSFRILKATPDGVVSTVAGNFGVQGNADGTGATARFSNPSSMAVDGSGNVYVADNNTIRKITQGGVVTTIAGVSGVGGSADGTGAQAEFGARMGIASDPNGNVYVADTFNNTIRKIASDGAVTTIAGTPGVKGSADGDGAAALFSDPGGIAVDGSGNIYVADTDNDTIRRITPDGAVTTLAGTAGVAGTADGAGTAAQFSSPGPMTISPSGNLFVADLGANTIREITPGGPVTTLFEGSFGAGSVAIDREGNLFAADLGGNMIWKITPEGEVTGFVGDLDGFGSADGTGTAARFANPIGAAVDPNGNLYVADPRNNVIRRVAPGGITTTFAGTSNNLGGSADGTGPSAQFSYPTGVAVDGSGNVYVADTSNNTIRKITPDGAVTTIAGTAGVEGSADGTGPAAQFNSPGGVAVDQNGNIYVADSENYTIRKITPAGIVTTLAGSAGSIGSADGTGASARFVLPAALAVDAGGNIYVADSATSVGHSVYANNSIRKITPAGVVTTLAGAPSPVIDTFDNPNSGQPSSADGVGAAARFSDPGGIAVDSGGNIYVADTGNDTIRRVTPDGVVTTMAGIAGSAGFQDGAGAAARFNGPVGIAVDREGNVYVVDSGNNTIRVGAYNVGPSVATEPAFFSSPTSQTVSSGATVVFSVASSFKPAPTYQWYYDGEPIAGATLPTLVVQGATEANVGYYDCSATNPLGIGTSSATLTVTNSTDPGRLINLSCRSNVGIGANVLIAGFVVGGNGTSGPEALLIRASGPALIPFDVTGVLPDPDLQIMSSNSGTVIATNNGWGGNTLVTDTAYAVGAFAWPDPSSHDSALVETLPSGPYTAQVSGASADSGIVLAEIYDATPAGTYSPTTPRLINISARNQVGRGANVLIAGFVIGGTTSKTILIRASGPALVPFGISGVLPDPQLQLNNTSSVIATNTGWGGDVQIAATAASVGAFSWGTAGSPDSAILVTLAPGAYTAQVSGASGDTGIALIEIYDVD